MTAGSDTIRNLKKAIVTARARLAKQQRVVYEAEEDLNAIHDELDVLVGLLEEEVA